MTPARCAGPSGLPLKREGENLPAFPCEAPPDSPPVASEEELSSMVAWLSSLFDDEPAAEVVATARYSYHASALVAPAGKDAFVSFVALIYSALFEPLAHVLTSDSVPSPTASTRSSACGSSCCAPRCAARCPSRACARGRPRSRGSSERCCGSRATRSLR